MASERLSSGPKEEESREVSSSSHASVTDIESQREVEDSSEIEDKVVDPFSAFREEQSEESAYEPSEKSPSLLDDEEDGEDIAEVHMPESRLSPGKRSAPPSPDLDHRPFKRVRGAFHPGYVALLNRDIEDAAAHYVPHGGAKIPQSQIGLTIWTPAEKDIFFEALSRLGRDDVRGIARRVKTKGELETRQYLDLLRDALNARKASDDYRPLHMADFPAAIELSPDCCFALDSAADALARRQESYEDAQEQQKWGENWLYSPLSSKDVKVDSLETQLPWINLFNMGNWLKLSERFFMNAPFEEGNWQSIGDPPSIRLTALEDFHSLAISITKRLVSATMYISMSRVRCKKAATASTRNLVRKQDVHAAVASLGLKTNSQTFWVGLARRLKLEVFEEIPKHHEDDRDPMPYNEVESSLSTHLDDSQPPFENHESEPSSSDDESSDSTLSIGDLFEKEISDIDGEDEAGSQNESDEDPEVRLEAIEVIQYSALGLPETNRARQGLIRRIKEERKQEAYADVADQLASYREEKRMWAVLGHDPPDSLVKVENIARPRTRGCVDDVVGSDWRENLNYLSEWEVAPEMRGLRVATKAEVKTPRGRETRETREEKSTFPPAEDRGRVDEVADSQESSEDITA